jgi:hypothetical protein
MLENTLLYPQKLFSRRELLASGLALAIGCKKSPDGGSSAPGISSRLQHSWPIWSHKDLAIKKFRGTAVSYRHTLSLKPDFYRGRMPLEYTSSQDIRGMTGGMTSGPKMFFSHDFGDFANYFVYENVWLKGAVSVDKASNTMIAEAKFNYIKRDGTMAIPTLEEYHYYGGKLVFHCFSELDSSTGFKIKETQKSGRKKRDYFFLMPIGMSEH